jgi:hypothetical protein
VAKAETDGGLCHPAPASPLAPNASGRAPSLRGRYPASSLLRAHPSGSRLRGASSVDSRRYLASAGFLRGARSPSLFPPMTLRACRRPLPRRAVAPQIAFRGHLLPSPRTRRLGTRSCLLTGTRPGVHSSLRPARSLTLPSRALSVGFAARISLVGATQAMRLRSSTASGLSPCGFMGTSRHH